MNMEHSWILILAMIGHVLCVYVDRLLLCTPGGQFSFSDMKDNARMLMPVSAFRLGFTNGLMSESMVIWFGIILFSGADINKVHR